MIEILQNIVLPAIVAALAAFATVATGAFGYWNRHREQDIEMAKIALSILSGDNKDTSIPGRNFALRALQEHTGIRIPAAEFKEWARLEARQPDRGFQPPNAILADTGTAIGILNRLSRNLVK